MYLGGIVLRAPNSRDTFQNDTGHPDLPPIAGARATFPLER